MATIPTGLGIIDLTNRLNAGGIGGVGISAPSASLNIGTVTPSTKLAKAVAAKAKVAAGTSNMTVMLLGDSTTASLGALGAVNLTGCRKLSQPAIFAQLINKIGMPANSDSFFGNQNTGNNSTTALNAYDELRITQGGWTSGASDPTLGGQQMNINAVGTFQFQPLNLFDTCEFYYPLASIAGTCHIERTGDSNSTTFNQNVTSGTGFTKSVVKGAYNANPIKLVRDTAFAFVSGMVCYNSAVKSVNVINAGWSGGVTADWIGTTNAWSPLNALISVKPDLVFLQPGINEWNTNVPVETFRTNLRTLCSTIVGFGGQIVMTTPFPSGFIGQAANYQLPVQAQYVQVIRDIAAEFPNDILLDDLWLKWGSKETMSAIAGYVDFLHPGGTGYRLAAEAKAAIFNAL